MGFKRHLSAISDSALQFLDSNDLLVPRSRTSTSQQCALDSAGFLLWNRLPAQIHVQILSGSSSPIADLLKFFLFPGTIALGDL